MIQRVEFKIIVDHQVLNMHTECFTCFKIEVKTQGLLNKLNQFFKGCDNPNGRSIYSVHPCERWGEDITCKYILIIHLRDDWGFENFSRFHRLKELICSPENEQNWEKNQLSFDAWMKSRM